MILEHGGNLTQAAQRYGMDIDQWLDLSTGISPWSWPVPTVPETIWQRLPESDNKLEDAARKYYQCGSLLAVPGSQFAIATLPRLFPGARVLMPARGYAEHLAAWQCAGHAIGLYHEDELDSLKDRIARDKIDVLLVINPNNPTSLTINPEQLRAWQQQLHKKGGCLVVDEAFMDVTPAQSLARHCPSPGLLVLRSQGKFFGLAGIRLGFVLAEQSLLDPLSVALGPWAVSAPARWIGALALADEAWQRMQRPRLAACADRLAGYLQGRLSGQEIFSLSHTGLFVSVDLPAAQGQLIYAGLAMQGILIRHFNLDSQRACLRFGLLKDPADWARFDQALNCVIVGKVDARAEDICSC